MADCYLAEFCTVGYSCSVCQYGGAFCGWNIFSCSQCLFISLVLMAFWYHWTWHFQEVFNKHLTCYTPASSFTLRISLFHKSAHFQYFYMYSANSCVLSVPSMPFHHLNLSFLLQMVCRCLRRLTGGNSLLFEYMKLGFLSDHHARCGQDDQLKSVSCSRPVESLEP